MVILRLIGDYFIWHYTVAVKNIFFMWFDFEWFAWNYFSIKQLTRTLFVPWKRLGENTKDYFDLGAVLTAVVVTTLMRLLGALIRLSTIIFGLFLMVLLIPLCVLALIAWILMPVILGFIFALGVELLVKAF
ncbi:MAG: hypothetical protein HY226_01325 [Candidatus Vogelbacteria bacterium]|nr:hypothetical protein [Candidatus Vogelbacteria bacterium]